MNFEAAAAVAAAAAAFLVVVGIDVFLFLAGDLPVLQAEACKKMQNSLFEKY